MTSKKEILAYVIIIIIGLVAAEHMNVVVSGSMEPVLYRGDIVVVEKVNFLGMNEFDPDTLKVDDIVVYNAEWFPNPVIHRIINVTEVNGTTYYTIKGDNNPTADPVLVRPEQITEKVLTIYNNPVIIPKVGYITLLLKGL
ncbi:signal peptidase I [Methanobrevibacter filiformis]|uniref:Signal peptidase I W n=1 Tax=Methanobrevibacter filiformis TaxID=55758 RepID=A0A166D6T4_9EURY|nr:signal peptidase I [Methanobrevibacter filiformis]KZX15263.1 signal peptidase I W [Methanobrevibacter filiformis]